jgi:hypothetical protein
MTAAAPAATTAPAADTPPAAGTPPTSGGNGNGTVDVANATLTALAALMGQVTRPDGMARFMTGSGAADLTDLQATVAALQQTVKAQGEQIQRLTGGS